MARHSRTSRSQTHGRRHLIAGLLGLVVLLLLATGFFPQGPLRFFVERELQRRVGPGCHIGSLHVVPALLELRLKDLSIETPSVAFAVKSARLRLGVSSLLGRAMAVDRLEMQQFHLAVHLGTAAPRRPLTSWLPLRVHSASLNDGVVEIDRAGHTVVTATQVRASGSLGEGVLEIHTGAGSLADTPFVSAAARLRVAASLDTTVESFELRSRHSRFAASGGISHPLYRPRAHARLSGDVLLSDIVSARVGHTSGRLRVEGTFQDVGSSHWQGSVSVRGNDLRVSAVDIKQLAGQFRRAPQTGTTVRVEAEISGGRALLDARIAQMRLDATLALSDVMIQRLPPQLLPPGPQPRGCVSGTVQAHGPIERPDLDGRLEGDVSWQGQAATRFTLQMTGRLAPRQQSVDLAWTAQSTTPLARVAQVTLRDTRLTLRGTSRGHWPPQSEADLSGMSRVMAATGESNATMTGQVLFKLGRVESHLSAETGHGRLAAALLLSQREVQKLDVDVRDLDLAALAPDLAGRVTGRLTAAGRFARLHHEAHARATGLAWRDSAFGDVAIEETGEGRSGQLTLTAPSVGLTATASVTARATDTVAVVADLLHTPLGPLSHFLRRPLAGEVSGRVEAQVPIRKPMAAVASLRLTSGLGQSGALAVSLLRPLVARVAPDHTVIQDLALAVPGGTLSASGRLGWSAAESTDAHLTISADLAQMPRIEGWTLAGQVQGTVDLKGPGKRVRAEGQVRLTQASLAKAPWPAVAIPEATLELAGDRIRVLPTELEIANGHVRLEGSVPFAGLAAVLSAPVPKRPSLTLDVRWENVEPDAWLAALRPDPRREPVTGALSGSARIHLAPEVSESRVRGFGGREPPASQQRPNPLRAPRVAGRLSALERLNVDLRTEPATFATRSNTFELDATHVTLSAGRVTTSGVRLQSSQGALEIGGVLDFVRHTLAASGKGVVALDAVAPWLPSVGMSGRAEGHLTASGALSAPAISGQLQLQDVTLRSRAFAQPLTELNTRLIFDASRVRIEAASARLGGGTLQAEGSARLEGTRVADLRLGVKAENVSLQYPSGLWSRMNGELTLEGRSGAFLLSGSIHTMSAAYTQNLATEKTLLAPTPVATISPTLRNVRLDLELVTDNPLRVRNDVARLEATGRLTIRGDLETPQPFGRLDVVTPAARVYLQGREFSLSRGSLSYDGARQPTLSLTGTTSLRYYPGWPTSLFQPNELQKTQLQPAELSTAAAVTRPVTTEVTAEAHGTATEILNAWTARLAGNTDPSLDETLRLSSSSGLSQADLASYLATGRSRSELRGAEARSVGEQAAALLASRLATGVFQGLGDLGLDEVRFQPEMIGREGNPGARFTFARRLAPYARLVYSRSLNDSEDSFFDLQLQPGWEATLTIERQDTGLFVYGAGQQLAVGGRSVTKSAKAPRERVRVRELRFEGPAGLSRQQLASEVRTRVAAFRAPWDIQQDAERLRRALVRQRYFGADVGASFTDGVALFKVNAGPRYRVEVIGMDKPPNLLPTMKDVLNEEEAGARGTRRLLLRLRERGYLSASVEFRVLREPGLPAEGPAASRLLSFRVSPGPRYSSWRVTFPGAKSIPANRLLETAGGPGELLTAGHDALARIAALYRARYFLAAAVGPLRTQASGDRVEVEVPIEEQRAARIAAVRFEGASVALADLSQAAGLRVADAYADARLLDALVRIRNYYWSLGMSQVRVLPRLEPRGADVEVLFAIEEGARSAIGGFEVRGVTGGLARRVQGRIDVKPGAPLDPRTLIRLERRVLDVPGVAGVRASPSRADPATVVLNVEPLPWARVRYELRYDRQNHVSVLVDGELAALGRIGTLGARYQQGSITDELRASLHSNLFGGKGLTGSLFRVTQSLPGRVHSAQRGVELQQAFRLPDHWLLLPRYRLQHVNVTGIAPSNVGALELSAVRETRDNPLDARRGRFWSLDVAIAHPAFGSTASFVKAFAQVSAVRALGQHFIWAQGVRVGAARAFAGAAPPLTERFSAGGPNSVRGFSVDAIGPRDAAGNPSGGLAAFVFNEELRYRHRSGLGLAAFWDVGNVFPTLSDVRLSARHSVGVGLRWASPLGLLRFDFAWPVQPRSGEDHLLTMFSIGQAF